MKLLKQAMVSAILFSLVGSTSWAETAWESYVSDLKPEHAQKVQEIKYSSNALDDEQKTLDLQLLEYQVLSLDRYAIDIAFRLTSTQNAEMSESFDSLLGRLVRINPGLFLERLKLNRSSLSDLGSLLCNLGEPFVDRLSAQKYELDRRIQALAQVKSPELIPLRDECVVELKKQIARLAG